MVGKNPWRERDMNFIIANIYLGSLMDARYKWKGQTLYVHEDMQVGYTPTMHIPILETEVETPFSVGDYFSDPKIEGVIDTIQRKRLVNPERLALAHNVLDKYKVSFEPLLIHCIGGVERSPLTLATWMVSRGIYPDLDAAYEYLMSRRDVVEDRRHWLTQPI